MRAVEEAVGVEQLPRDGALHCVSALVELTELENMNGMMGAGGAIKCL